MIPFRFCKSASCSDIWFVVNNRHLHDDGPINKFADKGSFSFIGALIQTIVNARNLSLTGRKFSSASKEQCRNTTTQEKGPVSRPVVRRRCPTRRSDAGKIGAGINLPGTDAVFPCAIAVPPDFLRN
jgi:hypothetical protein